MELYLHTEDNQILTIGFSEEDTVKVLQKKLKPKSSSFALFCNNTVLQPAFTLSFYNITNGDHIYVIPTRRRSTKTLILQQLEKTQKQSDNRMLGMKKESERLKDLMLKKVEGTSQYYRHVIERFKRFTEREYAKELPPQPPVVVEQLDAPAHEELPIFWDSN